MKRFLKVLGLLMVALFALVSGVDVTLDHLAHAPTQSSFTSYTAKGQIVVAYKGKLALCRAYMRPAATVSGSLARRVMYAPPAVD